MQAKLLFKHMAFWAMVLVSVGVIAQTNLVNNPNAAYQPPVFEQNNRLENLQKLFPVVEKIYKEYAEKNHFPGYSFGIVLDGKLVYSGAGGFANLDKKIPASPKTLFRIASMSKSFTSMAILKLRDEGKIQLDDPVWKYIPEIKGQGLTKDAPEITIRNLMSHSAGFPEDNPWGDRQLAKTDADLIAMIKKGISFSNDAGLTYEYSNMGFAMQGYIIKKVTGMSYADYIAKYIWKPLAMDKAEWEYTKIPDAELAHGYRYINNNWREEALLHDGIYGAMGGMIVNIESFAKYMALHQDAWPPRNDVEKGPVKRSSIREMHQPWRFAALNAGYKYPSGRATPMASAYAYGLRWSKDGTGRETVGHTGGLPGFGSNWVIAPEFGIGVMFFANVTYAPTSLANVQVMDTLIRAAGLQARQLPPSKILTQRRDQIVQLLPSYSNAKASKIFAENFFDDYDTQTLAKEATDAFSKLGKITKVGPVVPENQLRGYFNLDFEKGQVQIYFTLTPENPALIQEYHFKVKG